MTASKDYSKEWELRPDLIEQWDTAKNPPYSTLSPKNCQKRYHWKCDVAPDHVWEDVVRNRFKTRPGCRFCPGRGQIHPSSTYNLALLFPEVAAEWDWTKNEGLSPDKVGPNSPKKVHWICSKNNSHKWFASIGNRTRRGTGCPACRCRGQKIIPYVNSLAAINPDLAAEWHPSKNGELKPDSVAPKARRSVFWQCAKDPTHEWRAAIYSRASGVGCPHCSNRAVNRSNSFAVNHPKLLKEWNAEKNKHLDPNNITDRSTKKVWWRCAREASHQWTTSIRARVLGGTNCPMCRGSTSAQEIRVYCELKALIPDAESRFKLDNVEADIFMPSLGVAVEYDGSYWHRDKVSSDRKKNRHFESRDFKIVRLRCEPLEKLGPKDVIVPEGELTKEHLDALIIAISQLTGEARENFSNYLLRENFLAEKAYRKYLSYLPSPFPENSLHEREPEVASQFDYQKNYPLTPRNFSPGSHKKLWWRCENGHSWQAQIKDRVSGNGCPYCSGFIIEPKNFLMNKNPKLAKELVEIKDQRTAKTLVNIPYLSSAICLWRCSKCNTQFQATPKERSLDLVKCPTCHPRGRTGGREPRKLNITLAGEFPVLAEEWHPVKNRALLPEHVSPGSDLKVWWCCKKQPEHEWQASVSNRAKGRGCPECSNRLVSTRNSLANTHPQIAAEWDHGKNRKLTPEQVVASSAQKVWWLCAVADDHSWKTQVRVRTTSNGCPFCSGRRLSKTSSLAALRPELAAEWHPSLNGDLTPESVIVGSTKRAWWQCSKNPEHVWESVIEKRGKGGRGCPYCAGRHKNELMG